MYVLEGGVSVGGKAVGVCEAALLTGGEVVEVVSEGKARFVLIAGKPHGEPIALRGSFVY